MNVDTIAIRMPEGYRWADDFEAEIALSGMDSEDFIQVRVGGTDESPWTDIAVKDSYRVDHYESNDQFNTVDEFGIASWED